MTYSRTAGSAAIALSLAVGLLLLIRPALGQGTSRVFPDPMSFEHMSALLAPLALSDAQRTAVGFEHARYLEGFRILRDGAIETYLGEFGSTPLDFREHRDEIVDGTRRRRSILRGIETLDTSFFTAVEAVLSDEQKLIMPRLADRRERRRLTTDPSAYGWELPPLGNLDLISEIDAIDLADDKRAEIDPLVAAYETSLTPHFRKIHGVRLELPLAVYDRTWETRRVFEERMKALQTQFDLDTAEGQKAYAEAAAATVRENSGGMSRPGRDLKEQEEIREEFVRISRLDRRLLRELRPLLAPADADRLERRVTRRAFGMLGIPGDPVHRRIAKHTEEETTSPELRAALESLQGGYRDSRSALIDRMIAAAEQERFTGTGMNVFFFGGDGQNPPPKDENPVAERRDAIKELNDRTLETYAALTGEEIPKHEARRFELTGGNLGAVLLDAPDGGEMMLAGVDGEAAGIIVSAVVAGPAMEITGDGEGGSYAIGNISIEFAEGTDLGWAAAEPGEGLPVGVEGEGGVVESIVLGGMHAGPRGWLPGAIQESVVNRLADDLGLDESGRPLIDALYDDYREAFRTLDEQVVKSARSAIRGTEDMALMFPGMEPTEPVNPEEAFARVRRAMEAIAQVDQQFFGDLAVVIRKAGSGPIVERAARSRRRAAYAHLGGGSMFEGFSSGSREDRVDLIELSMGRSAKLEPGDLSACRRELEAYDLEATALYAERWNARLEAAEHQAAQMREAASNAGGGAHAFVNIGGGGQEGPAGAARRRADAAERGLRELNMSTLPRLAGALSDAGHASLLEAYQRQAFPNVFRDGSALERTFRKALALEIPPERRSDVEQLCLDYRGAYAAVSQRMIEQVRAYDRQADPVDAANPFDEAMFKRYETLQRGLEADRFERRNLSERTRHALRSMLDEDLAAQLGLGDA